MPDELPRLETRPQEQLLINALDGFSPCQVLCTSQGVAQLAAAAAKRFPAATVCCHYLDLYRAELARREPDNALSNLEIVCSPDFPPRPVDLAALPLSAQGEAELTREWLQEAHHLLQPGGTLLASTDNPRDRWLHGEMRKLFASVSRRETPAGAVYQARRGGPLARVRKFRCEFAFRDSGRLIHAVSRPGVFSHRELDPGARQLMAAMEIGDGDRVLEMGCGCGAVSFAAALRARNVHVRSVDSNARAVECTTLGAKLNGLDRIEVIHSASGPLCDPSSLDACIANPPYFAGLRIAAFFLQAGHAALRRDGRIYVVTKQPGWYEENMVEWFRDVTIEPRKDYWIAAGRR